MSRSRSVGQPLTCNPRHTVRGLPYRSVESVRIARVLVVDGLGVFLVLEVFAIELVGGLLSADTSSHE